MIRLIRWVASKLPHRLITGEDGTPYLSRYRVLGWMPGDRRRWPFSIYLHHFHRPDMDQDAQHDHPWRWALSLILSGGYTEHRGTATRELRAGSVNRIGSGTFHVISRLHGETWTLFVAGPKTHSWGFNVPGQGFVPWRERLAQRIEADYPPEAA